MVSTFLTRHSDLLKPRLSKNIKRSRAAVSRTTINEYFNNLEINLENVPPQNIFNYDETNFIDDPGRSKVLVRKKNKHADLIMDSTKSATSVMFSINASGGMLPPYVVYKALQMWEPWTIGGPEGCRYNRSQSGWFDQSIFEEWFQTIIIPHCRRLEGTKVVIGDKLASHISVNIVKLCKQHDIKFIFLPPNSTHLTQPLDVCCFRPMKIAWRKVLKVHKLSKKGPLTKDEFPKILKKTLDNLQISQSDNIKSGFSATGIYPLNREKVLKRLPDETNSSTSSIIPQVLHDLFKESRFGSKTGGAKNCKRKRYNIEPGRSVTEANMYQNSSAEEDEPCETEHNQNTELNYETEQNQNIELNYETEQNKNTDMNCDETEININNLQVDDFVRIKFETIKSNFEDIEYIGQITEIEEENLKCRFLRKSQSMKGFFVFQFIIDEAYVDTDQVVKKLKVIKEKRGNYQFE